MPEPAGPPADHAIDRSSLGAQNARLAERSFQKIVLQCQLPDLGMQSLQVDSRFTTSGSVIEHTGSALQKLRFPLRDLIRMNVEALRKVRQCHLALQRPNATLALKPAVWFRRVRLPMIAPDPRPSWPSSGRNST